MSKMASEQATADTSGVGKFFAGAGKAVADMGLGIRQLVGNASQQEVDDTKARDSALMDSGAGMLGNVAGNVGMAVAPGLGLAGAGKALGQGALQSAGRYALASPATLGGAATQGAMGAVQAGLQPVATGENRFGHAALGAVGGAAIPATGMALRGAGAALEPMYNSGREAILGRTLRRVAGSEAEAAAAENAMRGAQPLVPGSMPTAGQSANNAGIAALERAAFATEPAVTVPVAQRLSQQNEARVAALKGLAPGGRDALEKTREATAGALYRQAREQGVDSQMASALKPQVDNLMERMPSGVLEKAKELARLNGEVMDKAGSVNGLHWIKTAVDDMISGARETGIGTQTKRALTQFKSDLLSVVDELSPLYKQGREAYAATSRPINQADIIDAITKRAVKPLDESLTPAAYARALSDDVARGATGFSGTTLANTMEPQQMAMLNAIKNDLARSKFAETAGRGVGSDTVQKMAYHNLMQQTGLTNLPNLLSRPVQLAEYGGRAIYGSANKEMSKMLAEAMLDPHKTAQLMSAGVPNQRAQMLAQALRSGGAPLAIGAVPALLNSR